MFLVVGEAVSVEPLAAMVGSRGLRSLCWSSTHSRAERLPRRYCQADSGTPVRVVCGVEGDCAALLVGAEDGFGAGACPGLGVHKGIRP